MSILGCVAALESKERVRARRAARRKITDQARREKYRKEGRLIELHRSKKTGLIPIFRQVGKAEITIDERIKRYKERHG